MWTSRGAWIGLAVALLTVSLWHEADAAEIKLANVSAAEEVAGKRLSITRE